MKKEVIFVAVSITIVLLSLVVAQISTFSTTDSAGKPKDIFTVTDEIYIKSDARVCTINKNISLYIVADKADWNNAEELIDVRGESQEVVTSAEAMLPLTKIWSIPKAGKYDVVLDCNNNGLYDADPILEPLFSFSETGFTVTAPTGIGTVSIGQNNPLKASVQYDPESPNLLNEMMQFTLQAEKEDITIETIGLKAFGDGNDLTGISKIELYLDKNNDARKDLLDEYLGESAYEENDGSLLVDVNYTLTSNNPSNFIVVYIMNPDATGNFSLYLKSVFGTGVVSGKVIEFSGTPVSSNAKEFITPKSCLGSLTITYSPIPAQPLSTITAQLRNVTGCSGNTINIQNDLCGLNATVLCSCVSGSDGCSCDFRSTTKTNVYYACIDKNKDKDYFDFGESTSQKLDIVAIESPKSSTQNNTTGQLTGNLTGEAIQLGKEIATQPESDFKPYYIILEVTLVLILIVLLFILVSLGKRSSSNPILPQQTISSTTAPVKTTATKSSSKPVKKEKEE